MVWVRVQVGSGWSEKYGSGHGLTRFCFGSKKSCSSQVFFGSGQVRKFWSVLLYLGVGSVWGEKEIKNLQWAQKFQEDKKALNTGRVHTWNKRKAQKLI